MGGGGGGGGARVSVSYNVSFRLGCRKQSSHDPTLGQLHEDRDKYAGCTGLFEVVISLFVGRMTATAGLLTFGHVRIRHCHETVGGSWEGLKVDPPSTAPLVILNITVLGCFYRACGWLSCLEFQGCHLIPLSHPLSFFCQALMPLAVLYYFNFFW